MALTPFYDHTARQSMSIYAYTRAKLLGHGAGQTADGRLILNDKHLFLLFVKLERARCVGEFDAVHARVRAIEDYLLARGKRAATVFAYMYVYFDGLTVETRLEPLEEGRIAIHKTYRRPLSQSEIAIQEWATAWWARFGWSFLRVVRRSKVEVSSGGKIA